ncbi:Dyp-type peroxidase [Hoeflea ulvae]|uniref:Peroxidase n=1 Tax=Hoeflea ulvae TaxID=2983764 RepID=A0ABT3YIJ2_9HYPH|nr:hypothetical protein [Hoeflea ulvae]MCY0095720.1 hypothetical protein [Hoeflea ulvae]
MAATKKKHWKLKDSIARETQGFVASGFGSLKHGCALFLELPDAGNGKWIAALQTEFPVTPAFAVGGGAHVSQAVSIAFTWSGLQRLQMPKTALASFSAPFREGMFEENRMRRLGDKRKGEWQDTVIDATPRWSGNTQSHRSRKAVGAYSVEADTGPAAAETDGTIGQAVHALVLIYTEDEAGTRKAASEIGALLESHDVRVVHSLSLQLDEDDSRPGREHFGFADGISQPVPFDERDGIRLDGQAVKQADMINGAPLGEFLMGHLNGHQEIAPGPVVPGQVNGEADPRPYRAGLPEHPDARSFYDIGRNGTYLVVRELRQDVAAFWRSMEEAAEVIRKADPKATTVTAEWLAEKVVGRNRDGDVLRPQGRQPQGGDGRPDNDFLYFDDDRHGHGCPLGSHVRRANPRDSLAPREGMKQSLLSAANNHRILRRGRNYGPRIDRTDTDDGADRGLLFMCLNTDIARQFEFIQQTWLLNPDFSTLFEEVDPLVGPDGWMTIPQDPLRRRIQVKTFVQLAGGEYFFLPSLPALRYLALL